jgi:hypothetical protein
MKYFFSSYALPREAIISDIRTTRKILVHGQFFFTYIGTPLAAVLWKLTVALLFEIFPAIYGI